MVNSQNNEYENSTKQELAELDRQVGARNDAQFAATLTAIAQAMKLPLRSFDDLADVNATSVALHVDAFTRAVAQASDQEERSYAVESLLFGVPDLSFETVLSLYKGLPSDTGQVSGAKDFLGNTLVEKADDRHATILLETIESSLVQPQDCFALIARLSDISADRIRIIEVLQKAANYSELAWPVADSARKLKATELLPKLKRLHEQVSDKEIAARVQKTIDYLTK
jgi:hypothetical protein